MKLSNKILVLPKFSPTSFNISFWTTIALFQLSLFYLSEDALAARSANKHKQKNKNLTDETESPLAASHKFIYNNENICGDMFSDPAWLPAHRQCNIDCKIGAEFCQISFTTSRNNRKNQRCLQLPMECQRRLKIILDTGFGLIEWNYKKKPKHNGTLSNHSLFSPQLVPQHGELFDFIAPFMSNSNQSSSLINNINKNESFNKKTTTVKDLWGDNAHDAITESKFSKELQSNSNLVNEPPQQQFVNIPTLAPPKIPPHLTSLPADDMVTFDSMTITTTTASPLTNTLNSDKGPAGLDQLLPFTNDNSLLAIPEIVLSSSTFPPGRPLTTPPSSFILSPIQTLRTTVAQPIQISNNQRQLTKSSGFLALRRNSTTTQPPLTTILSNKWNAWSNNPSTVRWPPYFFMSTTALPYLKVSQQELTTSFLGEHLHGKPDDSLQHNYENLFLEKTLSFSNPLETTTVISSTTQGIESQKVFSSVWSVETTTTTTFSNKENKIEKELNEYDENNFLNEFNSNNIFGIEPQTVLPPPPPPLVIPEPAKTRRLIEFPVETSFITKRPSLIDKTEEIVDSYDKVMTPDLVEQQNWPFKQRITTTIGYDFEEPFVANLYNNLESSIISNNNGDPYSSNNPEPDSYEIRVNSPKSEYFEKDKSQEYFEVFGPPLIPKPYNNSGIILPPVFVNTIVDNKNKADSNSYLQSYSNLQKFVTNPSQSFKHQKPQAFQDKNWSKTNKRHPVELKTAKVKSTHFTKDFSFDKLPPLINKSLKNDFEQRNDENNEKEGSVDITSQDSFFVNEEKVKDNLQEIVYPTEKHEPWWIWRDLTDKLDNKMYSSYQKKLKQQDTSVHCCQWAMDGLCDRNWQRVRILCPKSCGVVICSSTEGTLSCNRVIDVDAIDCYEQRQKFKAFGFLLTNFDNKSKVKQHNDVDTKLQTGELNTMLVGKPKLCENEVGSNFLECASSPSDIKQHLNTQKFDNFEKNYAIEDEIKRFKLINNNGKMNF